MRPLAIVTGASGAIGAAVARRLATEGYDLVINGRRREVLEELAVGLRDLRSDVRVVVGDVGHPETWAALTLHSGAPRAIDCLVHAGGGNGEPVSIAELSLAQWRCTLDDNLTSTYLALHTVLPCMWRQKHGVVITVASTAGEMVFPANPKAASPAYCAAKAGVLMLTRQAARESAPHDVRVSCVSPGPVMNERMAAQPADVRAQIDRYVPLGRAGEPGDVAEAVMYLVNATWVTGETLSVNGGTVMS